LGVGTEIERFIRKGFPGFRDFVSILVYLARDSIIPSRFFAAQIKKTKKRPKGTVLNY